jgi:hypothetical protein
MGTILVQKTRSNPGKNASEMKNKPEDEIKITQVPFHNVTWTRCEE